MTDHNTQSSWNSLFLLVSPKKKEWDD